MNLDAHAVDVELDGCEGKEFASSHGLTERTVIEIASHSRQRGLGFRPSTVQRAGQNSGTAMRLGYRPLPPHSCVVAYGPNLRRRGAIAKFGDG